MKFRVTLAATAAALLLCTSAFAQLRAPRDNAAPAAAPQAPAAAGAPANGANEEKETAGRLAAGGWLVLLDRRDWGSAWENSSAVFRAAVPLAKWMDGIPKVREEFGTLAERTPAETAYRTKLEGRPDGEYVTVLFVSKFANKEVLEAVTTVREADGRWRVTGYSTR